MCLATSMMQTWEAIDSAAYAQHFEFYGTADISDQGEDWVTYYRWLHEAVNLAAAGKAGDRDAQKAAETIVNRIREALDDEDQERLDLAWREYQLETWRERAQLRLERIETALERAGLLEPMPERLAFGPTIEARTPGVRSGGNVASPRAERAATSSGPRPTTGPGAVARPGCRSDLPATLGATPPVSSLLRQGRALPSVTGW